MQPPKDITKDVTFADKAHLSIAEGVKIMRDAVGSTYGPGGRNVLIKKKYVQPILTRDGVTVARDIAGHGNRLKDTIATEAAKLMYQASEKTNKTAGDGTTATVLLAAALYEAGRQRIVAGEDAMVVKRSIDTARDAIVSFVDGKSQKCDAKKLKQVAEISSGDPALGAMISDLVWEVGADGAITINYHNAPFVEVEKVTGYLFNQGFRHMMGEAELDVPLIFVSQQRLATRSDMIPVLELVSKAKKQVVIIADVSGPAMETFVGALANKQIDGVIIPPPAFGADGHEYFEDIAIYTGANLWMESQSFRELKIEDFGLVKSARVNNARCILFGDNTTGDQIVDRITAIKKQMEGTDVTPSVLETLEQRYAKLAGKISIIKVGAATEVEREELFFRVEDAVEACKSALSAGVVAGGATTLLFASKEAGFTSKRDDLLDPFIHDALQKPFSLLMSNAAEDGGYRKQQVLKAGYGKGFNLRKMTDEPVDLIKDGIVDATKVVVQTVQNSFSVAGALLTTGTVITEEIELDAQSVQAQ